MQTLGSRCVFKICDAVGTAPVSMMQPHGSGLKIKSAMLAPWHGADGHPCFRTDSIKNMAPRCWVKSPNGFSIFLRPPSDDTRHIHPCGPRPSSARTLFRSRRRHRRHCRCSRRRRRYQRHRAGGRRRHRCPRVAAAAAAESSAAAFS